MINVRTQKKNLFYDNGKNSRFDFIDQQSRNQHKIQSTDNINALLQTNFNKIIDLIKERRNLLLKKADILQIQNKRKLQSIAKARNNDLKNQARFLKDQSVANLLENVDQLDGTKNLLQKIIKYDINTFDNIQKNKGKKYWQKFKQIDTEIHNKNKKYLAILADLEKITQKERFLFQEIQRFQAEIIQVLTHKQKDYMRRAQQSNDQINKRKSILKQNKITKDKKKRQLIQIVSSMLDTIKFHQDLTLNRQKQVQQLFFGIDGLEGFDQFLSNFQIVVQNKIQDSKSSENGIKNLTKFANDYQSFIDLMVRNKQQQNKIFELIADNLKKSIKINLLQKAYLTGISTDKNDLLELIKKCKFHRKLLGNLQQDRTTIKKQIFKIKQLNNYFYDQFKTYSNQATRKQQLKLQLQRIILQQNQLEENQKKKRNFNYSIGNLDLKKKNIQMELQQLAQKGDLVEYKDKAKQLEKIQRQIEDFKNIGANQNNNELEIKLLTNVQSLNDRYSDLIRDVIVEDKQMTYLTFLNKLTKRLSLI